MNDNEGIVVDFCNAWERLDLDELMGFFTDDVVYHNIPLPPAHGLEQVRTTINGILGNTAAANWEVKAIGSKDEVVLTERVDRFEMMNGKMIELPVMGTFELRDGKIARWRDYFDLQTWLKQSQGN
jgi:limonene-1,2-epoxide hydrolase